MAVHHIPLLRAEVTHPVDITGCPLPQWHEAADARAIIASLLDTAPAYVAAPLPCLFTGQTLYEYDRSDPRVRELHAFASGWFAATGSFDLTVDEVIGNALAVHRKKQGRASRLAAYLNDGFTLGEAHRMEEAA